MWHAEAGKESEQEASQPLPITPRPRARGEEIGGGGVSCGCVGVCGGGGGGGGGGIYNLLRVCYTQFAEPKYYIYVHTKKFGCVIIITSTHITTDIHYIPRSHWVEFNQKNG